MKDHEVKALFKTTLGDFQLSRNERGEIRDLLDFIKDNEQKRALYRSMAFDEAREALGRMQDARGSQRGFLALAGSLAPTGQQQGETIPGATPHYHS